MSETPVADTSDRKDLLKRAFVRMDQLERELRAVRGRATEPIAVIGMGCRFPGGASNPERFRELLFAGFDATGEIPNDRWDVDRYYDPDPDSIGTMYVRRGAFLKEPVGDFDAPFFGIAPREADGMDPQQRLLAEVVWETFEQAGQSPDALRGSATGVFVGMAAHDWSRMQAGGGDTGGIGTYYGTGAAHSVAAGRISYLFGLKGPALTIDTACSSSLVALHEACQSLRSGETRMALAAGVSLILAPDGHVIASRGRMLSPRGFCSTFDASADGYVRGEGCAVVLLKRLEDARADGDRVLAVVRGTAANQDGRSGGLTVPSGTAQEEVMRAALAASGLQPEDVDYVEAHGTGTELGDPIEIHALAAVHAGRPAERPLLVGSVKTNVGHLEGAAGLAGVIKMVIAFGEDVIPKHLHFETPNPHITWDTAPIAVTAEATPWPRAERRVAGVSSFGFSGTNVHVVLEAAPRQDSGQGEVLSGRPPLVVPISARDSMALREAAGRLADALDAAAASTSDDEAVARTLARGRAHWEERAAIVAGDEDELRRSLRALARGASADDVGLREGVVSRTHVPRVAFLFTGQGAQRVGMGRELLETEPVFRAAVERCDALIAPRIGVSIAELMRAASDDSGAAEALRRTEVTQPALFVLEYALAELWRSWGVTPTVVLGHSVGEFAAACVAGVLQLEDALNLVAERARLMGSLPDGGAMATLFADEAHVRALVADAGGEVDVAGVNAPGTIVVSGPEAAIATVLGRAAEEGIQARRLEVSHAFHSRLMEPIVDRFRAVALEAPHAAPSIDLIAAATGERAGPSTFGADYWARQIREPVLFARSMESLRAEGVTVLVEIGPAPVLLSLAASCSGAPEKEIRQPTLRPGADAARSAREALASLYVAGVPIDWSGVYPGPIRPVNLPTYPFQRSRHWFQERRRRGEYGADDHPLLGRRIESPHFSGTIFEVALTEDDPAWVAQHRVFDRPVLPAAAYVEMCRAAVAAVAGEGQRPVRLRILEPLVIAGETAVQTIVDPTERTIRIASRDANGQWRINAESEFEASRGSALALPDFDSEAGIPIDVAAMLASIEANGVSYGPAFRGLTDVRRHGDAAVGTVSINGIPGRERASYGLHPALLDAAFQLCGACVDASDSVYLPVEIESIDAGPLEGGHRGDALHAKAILREGDVDASALVCDVEMVGADRWLRVSGLRFQRARRPARTVEDRIATWLYEPVWDRVEIPAGIVPARIVVYGQGEISEAIAAGAGARGADVQAHSPSDLADWLAGSGDGSGADVIVVVPGSEVLVDESDPVGAMRSALDPLISLGRAAASGSAGIRSLAIVTTGAAAVAPYECVDPVASAARAMAHTMAAELGGLACRRIDLGADLDADVAGALILDVVGTHSDEDRLALRRDGWYAERLDRIPAPPVGEIRPDGDYQLGIRVRGDLGTLDLAPTVVPPPAAGEVTIRVEATGLNFRDVLNALNMYPGDAGALGSECVGIVERVGEGVEGLEVGDRVMSVTPSGFCSRVNASAALTVPVPAGMTAGDAAGIPIAFLTADWALSVLARLIAGERVLIHAAAGGVGLAAVQLAQAVGAEIFATAGSPRKRSLLRRLGVQHVYSSRSLDFREGILRDTDGAGVDVVLNSLADDFIPASLDVLAERGRFVEIGKTGVWDSRRVAEMKPDASYHVLYLGEACESEPQRVRARFLHLIEEFERGVLRPLPYRGFVVDDAVSAFPFMAQARHIGKIVLFDDSAVLHELGDGAVWITGGLGGMGLELGRQFAQRGVRRVVLTSRSEPSPEVLRELEELRARGVDVAVLRGDVGVLSEVERIRDEIEALGWRLDHVVHAAAVLDDAALIRQSWTRFATVLSPKALGAWNLHVATRRLPLRSFVLCSAGAGLLGSPGQAGYAAANGFLDGLAHLRRSEGLPATSIAWGPWANVGMAARAGLDWSDQGLQGIDGPGGMAALLRLKAEEVPTPAVLPTDWRRFPARDADGRPFPLFHLVAGDASVPTAGESAAGWRRQLETPVRIDPSEFAALSPEELSTRLLTYVVSTLASVLRMKADRIHQDTSIAQLGFDSLMAVDFRNRVETDTGVSLTTAAILAAGSPAELASELWEAFDTTTATPTQEVTAGELLTVETFEF